LYFDHFRFVGYPTNEGHPTLQVKGTIVVYGFNLVFQGILSSLCSKDFFCIFMYFGGGELSYWRGVCSHGGEFSYWRGVTLTSQGSFSRKISFFMYFGMG